MSISGAMRFCCSALLDVLAVCTVPAAAQVSAGWLIEADGVASPQDPTVTIRVSAWFDFTPGEAEMFAGARFDLAAEEPIFAVQSWRGPFGVAPFLQYSPVLLRDVQMGQLNAPPVIRGDPSNPIVIFEVDWTATDFAPRRVGFETETGVFAVYRRISGSETNHLDPSAIIEGRGFVQVVPAPGLLVMAGAFVAAASRRRR
jgi:hypothetical protein